MKKIKILLKNEKLKKIQFNFFFNFQTLCFVALSLTFILNVESDKSVENRWNSRDLIVKNMKVEKNDFKVFNVIYGVLPADSGIFSVAL